ncbi:hypothetical protein [Lactiplantibacillus plantarum]
MLKVKPTSISAWESRT